MRSDTRALLKVVALSAVVAVVAFVVLVIEPLPENGSLYLALAVAALGVIGGAVAFGPALIGRERPRDKDA